MALRTGVRASFWRGGTSNGLLLDGRHFEAWRKLSAKQKMDMKYCERALRPFFEAAMGSPDPYGRQLNGMGGGISSLSKAVIVDESSSDTADVDYWFVQIGIKDGALDMSGNCGNMSSAVAPFALNTGLLRDPSSLASEKVTNSRRRLKAKSTGNTVESVTLDVKLRNMNSDKRVNAQIEGVETDGRWEYQEKGNYMLDGVPGRTSMLTLSFLDPAGSKTGKALPTGNPIDALHINGQDIQATLSDVSNPGVFIDGRQVGWDPTRKPEELTAQTQLMSLLEAIRREGALRMGMDPNTPSIPKIVMVYPPDANDIDVRCQALSMQQAHKAVPVTLAINLGVSSKMPGTIPYNLAVQRDVQNTVVGHPSGKLEVGAEIEKGEIKGAKLIRTARWLMDGYVNDTAGDEYEEV